MTTPALPTVAAHIAACAVVSLPARAGVAPPLAAAALFVLLLRAVAGLMPKAGRVSAKRIGVGEIGYGMLTVIAAAVGHLS